MLRLATRGLGTTVELVVTSSSVLAHAAAIVAAELEVVDLLASRFRPDSELARLNAAGGGVHPVSPELAALLDDAVRAARLTDGAVDPTVGWAVVDLGYDGDFAHLAAEASAATGAAAGRPARGTPGAGVIAVDRATSTVAKPEGVRLDLDATAKAATVDRVASVVAEATGAGVVLSIGGDVAVAGEVPPQGFAVGIAEDSRASTATTTVAVADGGVATSGTTVRSWVAGGRRRHHIVDPRTGEPAETPWRTVTVAAASCLEANIASTAAVVMGHEAPGWLSARGLPARLVDGAGAVTVVGGWPAEGRRR